MTRDDLRNIPSVQALALILKRKGITESDERATALARSVQNATRTAMLAESSMSMHAELDRQIAVLERLFDRSRFSRVLNGTGILIHTNLGRAPVSDETAQAMSDAASSAVTLELDPKTGRRGGRMEEISSLLHLLTGAETALVVNNNAAAILLALSALARGKRVAVSRAEAVEIGGGFRIPDVLAQSGAELVEVGTTNRTYASDYANADLGDEGLILKVHSSNFSIDGFVAHPALRELREVANERGWLLMEDLGSGTLVDTARFDLDHEPTIQESLEAGVDVVTFSGDKLLGGPQAGIIAGRSDLIDRISQAPLARAVRADKTTLAGVAATLRHYLRGNAEREIPVLRMIGASVTELARRAEAIAAQLEGVGIHIAAIPTTNHVGGGALPGQSMPGVALRLQVDVLGADRLARSLRLDADPPIYGRIEENALLIELRTIAPEDDEALVESLLGVLDRL